MTIFTRYFFKNLLIATLFIAVVLSFVIFLTQSLKFLDIVINAGSSTTTFWVLTSLALPRFFEVILPLAAMTATLFIYNKALLDSEMVVLRAVGHSSFALAKPALLLGVVFTMILWGITMWGAPLSLAKMKSMRGVLKTEFSTLLFREGVFKNLGQGLTLYVHERTSDGEMAGIMIHDARDTSQPPMTVLAKRGLIVNTDEGQQVLVFDGSRQAFDFDRGILQKLSFDRYTIDLPNGEPIRQRWAEPDERTITALFKPDLMNARDVENRHDFFVEIHRRFTAPLLALAFTLIAATFLVIGPIQRGGQIRKIILAVLLVIAIQSLYIAAYNMARNTPIGLILMYVSSCTPILASLFILSGAAETWRRKLLYPFSTTTEEVA